jgi:hypothetical protein
MEVAAARRVLAGEVRAKSGPAGSLEKVCGRGAALLAGEIESYAGAGFGLGLDDGMADDPGKDQRRCMERQVTVPNRGDYCREGGASLRDG